VISEFWGLAFRIVISRLTGS